jgi:hypothetical protein
MTAEPGIAPDKFKRSVREFRLAGRWHENRDQEQAIEAIGIEGQKEAITGGPVVSCSLRDGWRVG